jgi:twinkle protein
MSCRAGIPFHLPDAQYTGEQLREAYDSCFKDDRFFFHKNEHFDSSTIDGILNKVRSLHAACDCKYIVLDHLSFVVSDQSQGDERRALDRLTSELKRLTMDLGIAIITVCHVRRVQGTPLEEGGQISLSDLRGTAGIAQLSNIVLALERNSQSDDPIEARTVNIRVLKNRFCGRTGIATSLVFNDETYKYDELVEGVPYEPEQSQTEGQRYKGYTS